MAEKTLEDVRGGLMGKPWFKASKKSIQERLLDLGEDCIGFLRDLEARPDVIANVRVISIEDILIPDTRPIFGIFLNFKVQRVDKLDVIYHYQYFSWRQGSVSGAKGILLVKDDVTGVSHIIVNKGVKFSTGAPAFDGFGGFGGDGMSLAEGFKKEICEELGLDISNFSIGEVIDLGSIRVDVGMTPNYPKIFAGIISVGEAIKIREGKTDNPDLFELQMGTVIVPIEKLWDFVGQNDDSFFLACVARLVACKLLKP